MKLFFTELLTLDLIYSPRWISSKKDYDLARGLFFWGGGRFGKYLKKWNPMVLFVCHDLTQGVSKKVKTGGKTDFLKTWLSQSSILLSNLVKYLEEKKIFLGVCKILAPCFIYFGTYSVGRLRAFLEKIVCCIQLF